MNFIGCQKLNIGFLIQKKTKENKRVYGPHGLLAQIDDKNEYILFIFEAFGYYERVPKFNKSSMISDLKPLTLFTEWASKGIEEREKTKNVLNNQYKSMGLKYVVLNETETNEPLLTFKGGNIFGPGGNAYTKESVCLMIETAINWKEKLDSHG